MVTRRLCRIMVPPVCTLLRSRCTLHRQPGQAHCCLPIGTGAWYRCLIPEPSFAGVYTPASPVVGSYGAAQGPVPVHDKLLPALLLGAGMGREKQGSVPRGGGRAAVCVLC